MYISYVVFQQSEIHTCNYEIFYRYGDIVLKNLFKYYIWNTGCKKIFNILTAFFWAAAASNAFCNPFVCVERRLLPSTLDRDSLNPNSSPTVNPVKKY